MSNSRGGLSKREFAAKQAGKSMPYAKGGGGGGGGMSSTSSQYDALMKKYEEALSPSKAETKAQKKLNKLTTSYEKGTAKAGQEVMPMDLITGEKKGLLDQYGVQAGVYQRTIAEEQAKRGAAADILSAESGLIEKKMAGEQAAAERAQSLQDQMALAAYKKSLGGGGSKSTKVQSVKKTVKDPFGGTKTIYGTFNPSTGEYHWDE